jgi:hypothetical protein
MFRLATTFLGETALFPLGSVAEPVLHAAWPFLALVNALIDAFHPFFYRVVILAHRAILDSVVTRAIH